MTHQCPHCETFVDDYHSCEEGSDRVAFVCTDCGESQDRDAHQMDIDGIAPSRCASCVFQLMGGE